MALVPVVASWIHPELQYAVTTEEKFNIVAGSTSATLLESLPEELAGANLTLDNFHKYFNITVAYHGLASTPKPKISQPLIAPSWPPSWFTSTPSKLASSGDPIDPTKLLNVFKDTWNFVRSNAAVVNIAENNYAGATPDGVDWTQVRFEEEPNIIPAGGGQYQVTWKNGLGNDCAKIYYRIHWYAHGRYTSDKDGYIAQFTQLVDYAEAGWSVNVNAKSVVSPPINVGSTAPVGALTMNIDMWSGSSHNYHSLVVRGDGSCKMLDDNFGNKCQGPTPAPSPPPSYYKTITPSSNTNQCLDVPGDSAYNGALLWLWECDGGESQRFVFDNYQLRFGADESKCVDAGDMSNGMQLYLWDCNGYPQQTWGWDADASRIYLDGSATCLDSYSDWQSNGQPLHIWDCTGGENQEWSLWDVGTGKVTDMLMV